MIAAGDAENSFFSVWILILIQRLLVIPGTPSLLRLLRRLDNRLAF